MNETDEPCTIAVTIPNTLEGPVDNMKDKINKRTAAVIPVYSISDSDEERANAFMKNMSHSLLTEANTSQPAAELLKNSEVLEAQNTNVDSEIMEADDFNIPSACGQPKEEKPAVTITFMNTDFARKYRHDIEEFFHTLMTAESLSKNHDPLPTIQKRANLKGRVLDESTVIGSISVCRNYMVDPMGWPMIANSLNLTPGISIPLYEQIFAETYPPPEDAVIVEAKPIKTSKMCFNCGEDGHEAGKCPKPFDRKTFSRNRAKFKATGLQYGRYHKEERNKKMKPGELSHSLRESLGLKEYELPQHIYRMRQLGYPPGWLLHAEATNSGLAMFDKHGQEVDLDGDCMEDGEVAEHRLQDEANLKYNLEHLIAFPGFNTPCPEGTEDNALKIRGCPTMKSDHSLDAMISNVNLIREEESSSHPQKRTRYDSDTNNHHKRFKPNQVDMDLSDGEDDDAEVVEIPPPLPEDGDDDDDIVEFQVIDELPPEPLSPSIDESATRECDVSNINDSINALELQKQKLLAELNAMEENVVSSTPSSSAPISVGSSEKLSALNLEEGENNEEANASANTSLYQSMSYLVSTPVIQHSGIEKLPSYERFSDGITEHLPFENLPNSVGVYEKMSDVMKSVKEKMATIRPKRKVKK